MNQITGINPKDLIGATKPGLANVPPGPLYVVAQAFDDGAAKYGAFNWRDKPVRASIYHDACKRHLDCWFQGRDLADDSGIHHLGHAVACLLILMDAEQQDSLRDDRPGSNIALDDILAAMVAGGPTLPAPPAVSAPAERVVPAAAAAPATTVPAGDAPAEVADAPASAAQSREPASKPAPAEPKRGCIIGNRWTVGEEKKLLRAVLVDGLRIKDAADLIGRPFEGTKFRLNYLRNGNARRPAPAWAGRYIAEILQDSLAGTDEGRAADPVSAPASEPAPAVRPVSKSAPAPGATEYGSASWSALTLPQRALVKHLERLDDGFTPEDDMMLVERLSNGVKSPVIAADLGITVEELTARWNAMLTRELRGPNGRISIDGQRDLLAALRYRVRASA